MIQALWNRHYHEGVTGSYHGDMAHAYKAMLADADCDHLTRRKLLRAIDQHKHIETLLQHTGHRWFTEAFPTNTRGTDQG